MNKKKKRLVVISDLHCGHLVGLTPPRWQIQYKSNSKIVRVQRELWQWYESEIKRVRPIDILVVNGDAIEGTGYRNGGTDNYTVDRYDQCEMAAEAICMAQAPIVRMTYGTPYHTGDKEDWEMIVASLVRAKTNAGVKVESHAFLDINGLIFDIKHKIGASSIPHGRFTPNAREKLWNIVWNSRNSQQPQSDVVIRSHVHYFSECSTSTWRAITTPALQGYGSKYGSRQCSGTVDIGFLVFDVYEDGSYQWQPVLAELQQQKALVERL